MKLQVRALLSGIIVMTALYSVNLWIMGKANIPLYNNETIFDNGIVDSIFVGPLADFATSIILLVIVLVVKLILDWYLRTKSGFMLRAVGSNARLVTSMGINKGKIKIIGLVIANGLCTLGGCLYAQEQRYADVSMGTGTMVIGLASVIIGTTLFRKVNFMSVTTSVVIGSVLYKACVAVAVHFLRNANDLKLITSVLFLIILVVSMDKKRKVASEDA